MDKRTDLEDAEARIKAVGTIEKGSHVLFLNDGVLAIGQDRTKKPYTNVLMRLTKMDINVGLTSEKWSRLNAACHAAREAGTLK